MPLVERDRLRSLHPRSVLVQPDLAARGVLPVEDDDARSVGVEQTDEWHVAARSALLEDVEVAGHGQIGQRRCERVPCIGDRAGVRRLVEACREGSALYN